MTADILKIVIIDYGSGNLHSAKKAFVKALENEQLEGDIIVSNNPEDLASASHIVLPGVGAFGDCVDGLKALDGMIAELEKQVLENKKPFLGICVGMQMLAKVGLEGSDENKGHEGLGWLEGKVIKIDEGGTGELENLRIPHMGWNEVSFNRKDSNLAKDLEQDPHFYFVHSYYFKTDEKNIAATVNYGNNLTAIVEQDNIYGVQFHPEKSQKNGLNLIGNFLKI